MDGLNILEERILQEGKVLDGNILKVDSFVNHRIDPSLFMSLADIFYNKFKQKDINKILTIEVSGIAIAYACGLKFNCPVIFAKKTQSKTLGNDVYSTQVYSYTKKTMYDVMVSREFLTKEDHVLLIDDFLANGKALEGLIDICNQAEATVEGIGILIEKSFQHGGDVLREQGYDIQSLAKIESLENNQVVFKR